MVLFFPVSAVGVSAILWISGKKEKGRWKVGTRFGRLEQGLEGSLQPKQFCGFPSYSLPKLLRWCFPMGSHTLTLRNPISNPATSFLHTPLPNPGMEFRGDKAAGKQDAGGAAHSWNKKQLFLISALCFSYLSGSSGEQESHWIPLCFCSRRWRYL